METKYTLGIDISKKKLNAALTIDGKNYHEFEIENQTASIKKFFDELKSRISSLNNLIVCTEHTGIYGMPLMELTVKKGIRICVEPAKQIKLSLGMTRGKNDVVDARRIAAYAFKNRENLVFWVPQRECIQRLKAMLTTRDRLVKVKTQLEVPLAEAGEFISPAIRSEMKKHCRTSIDAVKKDIKKVERAIKELVKEDAILSHQHDLATSIPGIGTIVACSVIIASGEFKRISEPKKFACYAGVAPFEHSSGTSVRGKTRVSKMANMNIKKLLHLAATSAITCNEELKVFYHRKVAEGKKKMSVISAVRNKLISRIYACVTHQRKYQKIYQNALA